MQGIPHVSAAGRGCGGPALGVGALQGQAGSPCRGGGGTPLGGLPSFLSCSSGCPLRRDAHPPVCCTRIQRSTSVFCSEASEVVVFWPKYVFPTGVLQAGSSLHLVRAAGPPLHPKPRGSLWPKGGVVLALKKLGGRGIQTIAIISFVSFLPCPDDCCSWGPMSVTMLSLKLTWRHLSLCFSF